MVFGVVPFAFPPRDVAIVVITIIIVTIVMPLTIQFGHCRDDDNDE